MQGSTNKYIYIYDDQTQIRMETRGLFIAGGNVKGKTFFFIGRI